MVYYLYLHFQYMLFMIWILGFRIFITNFKQKILCITEGKFVLQRETLRECYSLNCLLQDPDIF